MTRPAGQPASTVAPPTVAPAGCPAAPASWWDLGPGRAAALAAPVAVLVGLLVPPAVAVACAAIAYLALRIIAPDLAHYRIPRGPCWQSGILGGCLALVAAAGSGVNAAGLMGTLPIAVGLLGLLVGAWWFGAGGFGDVRLVAALAALTAWWVTPASMLVGVGVCALVALGTAVARRQRAIPAGPALWALFAAAAATTLWAPVS